MNRPLFTLVLCLVGTCVLPAQTSLTASGKRLEQRYATMFERLRADLQKRLPKISDQQRAAYRDARAAEKAAESAVGAAQKQLGEIGSARGLVGHAKGKWIGGADRGIAAAKKKLSQAKSQADRKAAEQELAKWQKNREDGVQALRERQAKLDRLLGAEPRLKKELAAAIEAQAAAKEQTAKTVASFRLDKVLASSALDSRLAKFIVLLEATPKKLASYAQQSSENKRSVDRLLSDSKLMLQMVIADGAKGGAYGQAMKIYSDIQKASRKASQGPLQRLAVAIALEHAVPVAQRNPTGMADGPKTIDPVERYRHYEAAFEARELDPAFATLTTWDYRMVVDGNEPDDTLAWGRQMLSNYRPDHVYTKDYRWRYVAAVRTDIRYGSQDNKYDREDLQFFQNILMNGGICGRRAFFGRFILRAHGVPTTARPQRGHAALAHWTPKGWVVCLGGGWGAGWTKTRYNKDRDFLATTQARNDKKAYLQVKRAQWIGDVAGEKRVFGFLSGQPDFWYGVSLYRQAAIVEGAVALDAVGEELGEANESHVQYAIESAAITEADRQISIDDQGVIEIPAVATSNPKKSSGKIVFMPSNLGGKQLHYSRNGGAKPFEYTFDAPKAGRYRLTARVVTPSWQQHLSVTSNGGEPVTLTLPHTVGLWETTEPIEIQLVEGRNVLRLTHRSDGYGKGFSIRDFRLTPVGR